MNGRRLAPAAAAVVIAALAAADCASNSSTANVARATSGSTVGFDKDGDTTLKSYGVDKVAANGTPVFFETLTPARP